MSYPPPYTRLSLHCRFLEATPAPDPGTAPLTRLSPTLLAGHLACAHLTQLERQRHAGELNVEFNADPRLEALRLRGQQHEARYVERLRADGREVCDLRGTKDPAATRQ